MTDFTKLQQALSDAKSKFTGGADADADLVAASFALDAVIDHLRDIGTPVENTWPLVDLVGALENIRTGAECPLLKPRDKAGHRPPRPVAYDSLLATASAAITLLIQDEKLSKEEAARKVAQIFEAKKYPIPKTNYSELENWKAIAEWRDKLLRGTKSKEISKVYNKAIESARNECDDMGGTVLLEILKEYGGTA